MLHFIWANLKNAVLIELVLSIFRFSGKYQVSFKEEDVEIEPTVVKVYGN